jgi:hypothetical protein
VIEAADDWISSAGQLTGIRKPLGKAHADRRPERGRQARDEGIAGVVRRQGDAKIGASVESEPSISPTIAG